MTPRGAAIGLMTTWSPTLMPVTSADLDDLAGRFVAEWHPAGVRRQPAHRDVQRIRPADAARLHLHQHVGRPGPGQGTSRTSVLPGPVAIDTRIRTSHSRTGAKHFAPGSVPRLAIDTGRGQPYRDRHGKPRPRPADGDRSIPVTGPLDGRRAVVTGAATGLGAAAVRTVRRRGRVVATYHQTRPMTAPARPGCSAMPATPLRSTR